MINENLQRKKTVNYIRALLTLVILLLAVYNYAAIMEAKQYVILYLVIVVISNIVLWFVDEKNYEGTKFQFWIFMLDIIFIVSAAYLLTDMSFYFALFIFLTIFIASLSQSVALSIVVAVVVNAAYIFVLGSSLQGFALTDVKVLLNVPFIFLVALHSSYFAEKANEDIKDRKKLASANIEMGAKIKDADVELESLMSFTFRVYDSFRDGIIITDKNGYVKVFNSAAENIFDTRRSAVLNMHIRDLEMLGAVKNTLTALLLKKETTVDKEILTVEGGFKKLLVSTNLIKDKTGDSLGLLCTFKKVAGAVETPREQK